MKQQNESGQAQIFKIKHTKTVLWLCIGVLLLCGASIGVSVWQIIRFGLNGFSEYLKYPLLILISVFCIAVVISILVKSVFSVDKQYFITQFGFLKSRFPIAQITAMVLDTDTQKLTVYFGEQYSIFNVNQAWQDGLIRALMDANPDIDYSFTMAENKPQDEEK